MLILIGVSLLKLTFCIAQSRTHCGLIMSLGLSLAWAVEEYTRQRGLQVFHYEICCSNQSRHLHQCETQHRGELWTCQRYVSTSDSLSGLQRWHGETGTLCTTHSLSGLLQDCQRYSVKSFHQLASQVPGNDPGVRRHKLPQLSFLFIRTVSVPLMKKLIWLMAAILNVHPMRAVKCFYGYYIIFHSDTLLLHARPCVQELPPSLVQCPHNPLYIWASYKVTKCYPIAFLFLTCMQSQIKLCI